MQLSLIVAAPGFLNSSCHFTDVVRPSSEVALEGGGRCCLPASLVVVALGAVYTFSTRSPAVVLARSSAVVALHGLVPGSKGALLVHAAVDRRCCGAQLLQLEVDVVELLLSLVVSRYNLLYLVCLRGSIFFSGWKLREVFLCQLYPGGGECGCTVPLLLAVCCCLLG